METLPLSAAHKGFSWGLIFVSVCGGVILAVTVLAQGNTATSLHLPTTTRAVVAPAAVLENQPRRARLSSTIALAAAYDSETIASDYAGHSSTASPASVGMVAAMSTVFGALAMKFWGQRDQLSSGMPSDVEANAAGAAPMGFRTAAPWSSSELNGPAFSHETRGSRMVLQAAKGKGKGGGAKGKIAGIIKLALPAGKATPAPPVGPALGQYGLNIVAFCKEYNAATEKEAAENMIIPVEITAFEDRSYTFVLKTPPASVLLKKFAGVPSGSATPNTVKVGSVTRAQLEEIAKIKLPDLNTPNVEKAMKIVEGTAKQMGITISA